MNSFEWEDGTVIEAPYVVINNTKYYVQGGTISGGTPVSSSNLNEMETILNDNILEKSSKSKILWSNPSPTTAFPENAEIELTSDDYDFLIWLYCYNNNSANINIQKSSICLKENSVMMNVTGRVTGNTYRRVAQYSTNILYIATSAINENNAQDNNLCIPLYVIGCKF